MAEYIYSKVSPNRLLHIIHRFSEMEPNRKDLVPQNNFLQIATIELPPNKTFKPHKHKWNHFSGTKIAQESWLVLSGQVKAILYDIDNSLLSEIILNEKDMSITLEGGHNYLAGEHGARVIEIKTGPYEGQEKDKEFI